LTGGAYIIVLQIGYTAGSLASVMLGAPRTLAGRTMTATNR
jgi:hypothetical protein